MSVIILSKVHDVKRVSYKSKRIISSVDPVYLLRKPLVSSQTLRLNIDKYYVSR